MQNEVLARFRSASSPMGIQYRGKPNGDSQAIDTFSIAGNVF
ncbi:MAG: hypothetical protein OEZ43_00360 [Gammaproteobacteria bacterium]|nr:hypothetical protein [Gammaproteobacteria bacterium]